VVVDNCGQTLTPTGPVVSPLPGCGGTRTYTYTYTDCAGNTQNWVYTYTVVCFPLTLKVFLEGAYNPTTNMMDATLNANHLLPGQNCTLPFVGDTPHGQPYYMAPWNYDGVSNSNTGLQYGDFGGDTPYPPDVVDWVLVTVRKNGILPANNYWTCAGWVHTNGDVTFPDPCGGLVLNTTDDYFVLVQHRNHLGVLSPVEADMPCSGYVIDWNFTTSNSYQPTFRTGQKQVEPGTWAMLSANGEQVTSIQVINSPDRTLWRALQGMVGYKFGDYDMNASTNSADETAWKVNQNRTSGIIFY
jgi:hypothetical protein